MQAPPDERYERLRDEGLAAAKLGRFEESRALCEQALRVAEELGHTELTTRALCNLASVEIEIGRGEGYVGRLRDILVRNCDEESCRLAAYHVARYYDLRNEKKKALFYARIARERSSRVGNVAWLASSLNQTALLLLSESRFEEAAGELARALEVMPAREEAAGALIMDNLGYCRFLQGRPRDGFALCFRSLRILRRLGLQRSAPELTLTFGYLQVKRGERALRHGRLALAAAERDGDAHTVKNALFLLGEASQMAGDSAAAYDYFERLHRDFYPQQAFLPSFLLAVDVSGLVNLKA